MLRDGRLLFIGWKSALLQTSVGHRQNNTPNVNFSLTVTLIHIATPMAQSSAELVCLTNHYYEQFYHIEVKKQYNTLLKNDVYKF
uniref:Putative secreted protein n=1 Tax=Anopheles darlingi TaxID=43151 RepID=A0A2M4DFF2_ANODA